MAAAARAPSEPLHPALPDEILIWEVLLRLPPKALLRCRAVCHAWRRATSTHNFLLAHHGRQPPLPLVYDRNITDDVGGYLDIMLLEHLAGVAAAVQLQSIGRLDTSGAYRKTLACCDGLLVLRTAQDDSCFSDIAHYSVCNPATRQYAPLPLLLRAFWVAGMYRHPPTGEYRLLMYLDPELLYHETEPGDQYYCYVYALGSCEPPRNIGWPEAEEAIQDLDHVLFRGSLHWFIKSDESKSSMIMVFDTTAELFRQMRAPAVRGAAQLFDMDAMLGMARFKNAATIIVDIWMTQDYDKEVWTFKYRVKLPVAELAVRYKSWKLVVSSWGDDDVLILLQSGQWLLQIDMGGKVVASFHRGLLDATQMRLKQSLVLHTFFPTIEGYVVNTWPFISPDHYVVNT
ncbi:unnamed protein product [Alopecurus aequalis]